MSDTLEEEKRRKLIEAGRRTLEERRKKRLQQTPDGTNIDVKEPNSAPTVESHQNRRSELESLRLSTLRAKQELELNRTANDSTDYSMRNDKPTTLNGNSHPSQHANNVASQASKPPIIEQNNKPTNADPTPKQISEKSSPLMPSKNGHPVSPAVPNGTQTQPPKLDHHSNLIPSNGQSTTSTVPSFTFGVEQKYPSLLSPYKPDSPLPSQQPASPILSPTVAKTNPFDIPAPKEQNASQATPSVTFPASQPTQSASIPKVAQPTPTPAAPLPTFQPLEPQPNPILPFAQPTQIKPQSPIGSPRTQHPPPTAQVQPSSSKPLPYSTSSVPFPFTQPSEQSNPTAASTLQPQLTASPLVQPKAPSPAPSPVVPAKAPVPQTAPVALQPETESPRIQPAAQPKAPSPTQSPVVQPARPQLASIASLPVTQPQSSPTQSPVVPAKSPVPQTAPVASIPPQPTTQPEASSPRVQHAPKPPTQPVAPIELPNGTSEHAETIPNGNSTKNGSSSQPDRRLHILMDEVSNKNKELEDMKKRMEQYQAKYDAEVKKNEKLMDKLEFIKRKEMEERPLLEEIISRDTLELLDKLKEENEQLKNQLSNTQTQSQSLEKKSKQQLETISQLMSEKNQITQEMQRRIDRILESQAMNVPSQTSSPRPEIPNSEIESAQSQGKDAIRRLLEDKANLENKINEQWETIQSMSKQKTELLTRLANEAQRNEALIKENARLRNSKQTPPSPTPEPHHSHSHSHAHPHSNGHGQHHHASTEHEIEVAHESSGGWLTYIPLVGSYFSSSTPSPKQTRNV